ncbi:MAG: hypothetical protein KDA59_18565 [Planctomycetales bacterium]|nr:hypothetical protein [Planctomycetales bacterium]
MFVFTPPQDKPQEAPETIRKKYTQQFEELNKLSFSEVQEISCREKLQFPTRPFHISDGQIRPHNLPILAGEPVVFLNESRGHHLISLLPSRGERIFLRLSSSAIGSIDLKRIPSTRTGAHIQITDMIDGWMHAHVLVFNHRFFSSTDDDGTFEIKGLPQGEFQLAIKSGEEFAKIMLPKANENRFLPVVVDRRVNDIGTIDAYFERF